LEEWRPRAAVILNPRRALGPDEVKRIPLNMSDSERRAFYL
jgi:hypothetical protein